MEQLQLPRLDPRLEALAQLVRPGVRCADVGCDHGHLIAWLCASGRVPGGYACDINSKPLEKAAFALSQYGLTGRVKTVLCDGLAGIGPGQVEDVVIAGMGGDLIWQIIDACPWSRDPALRFVLQPMTKGHRLRQALYAGGFTLLQERAAVAGGFAYTAMQAAYTGQRREISPLFAWGGLLLEDPSPAAQAYLARAAHLVGERLAGLRQAGRPEAQLAGLIALHEQLKGRCTQ